MRFVVPLALAVLVVACASRPPPCPVEPAPTVAGAPLLWRVQRAAGPTVWLFGTIHDAGFAAVPRAALDALGSATRFASELGDGEPDRDTLRQLSRIETGRGIDQRLAPDDWWDLRDALRGVIREDDLRRARPWYALILLNRRSAPKTVAMDVDLARTARTRKLPVEGLETWKEQITALDSVVTIADLQQAIRARATLSCQYTGLLQAYAAADLVTLEQLLVVPRTAEPMLWARNRRWLPAIERYLADGGAFIAVGLGHMIGENGLPALLAKAGYTVERVPATR